MTQDKDAPSSRLKKAEPFHTELKAAFDGVAKAMAGVQKIVGSPDFPESMLHYYGDMILVTLKLEIDSLSAITHSASDVVQNTRRERKIHP